MVYDQTRTGFAFPESIVYDPGQKVFYVSNFGGSELKPAEKDGMGRISKVSLDGQVIESRFLPDPGDVMNKPKGLWVKGNRLWVTDIDSVWVFDLKTQKGKKLPIPGIVFANDPALIGNALYVSDSRADTIYKIEPADFLNTKEPKITKVLSGKSVDPNGLWPAKGGGLLIAGLQVGQGSARNFFAQSQRRGKEAIEGDRAPGRACIRCPTARSSRPTGTAARFSAGPKKTACRRSPRDFSGPADFCVVPMGNGYLVAVPDLVKSELRLIKLAK